MSDFEKLFAPIAVAAGATRPYRIAGVPGVELVVTIAGEANPPMWSAVLKSARAYQDDVLDPAAMVRGRISDADLWARYVVTGWKGVTKDDGTPATFSVDACRDFLTVLATRAPHAFDALRRWTKDPDNFTEAASNPAAVAKNS